MRAARNSRLATRGGTRTSLLLLTLLLLLLLTLLLLLLLLTLLLLLLLLLMPPLLMPPLLCSDHSASSPSPFDRPAPRMGGLRRAKGAGAPSPSSLSQRLPSISATAFQAC